jgi:glucose-6-phosphate-specific signal transduction histidine kinase
MTIGGFSLVLAMAVGIGPPAGFLTSLGGLSITVLGVQTTLLGVATNGFAQIQRLKTRRSRLDRFVDRLTLEKGSVVGGLVATTGALLLVVAAVRILDFMRQPGYTPGLLDLASTRIALLGTTLFVSGVQVVIASFFLGLFNIEPVSRTATRVVVEGALGRRSG